MTFIHHYFGGGSGSGGGTKRSGNDEGAGSDRAKRHAGHRGHSATFGNLPIDTLEHIGKIMARTGNAFSHRNVASLAGTSRDIHSRLNPL